MDTAVAAAVAAEALRQAFTSSRTNRPDINLAELNQFPPTGAAGSGGRGGLSLGQQGEDGADGQYVEVVQ